MRSLVFLFAMLWLASCAKKSETLSAGAEDTTASVALPEPVADTLFLGTYEYSEPGKDGYLYYRIELHQLRDSIKGTLSAGNYLASSESGYTNPNVLAECSLRGRIKDHRDAEILLELTKHDIMEEGAPDLLGRMNFPDFDMDEPATYWDFRKENGVLTCPGSEEGGILPLVWEKIK